MDNKNTPHTLFDQQTESVNDQNQILTPSEQFRLAHPDFIEPKGVVAEWDPNARRSIQLEGVGGGLRTAVDGELQETVRPVKDNKTASAVSRRARKNYEPRSGDSERGFGRPDYYSEPVVPTKKEKLIGRIAIQKIIAEQVERAKARSTQD